MDVLEIDAATNTQVDKVREVIIAGLGMAPVRDRYKIFIIDEVHRLSPQAFDALLKSIEEPPPHVVFMMATTEIDKVPATIQSRSQVFELKTIGVKPIADQLRRIADAEQIAIDDAALMLIARAGDGSMRDAQSAFDQVIAFAGKTIAAEDVATVLGLVRRDLLLDMADAVAREDAAAAFELAGQAVESGYDLRLVVRELARLTRDLLVVNVDPSRVDDPEIGRRRRARAAEGAGGQFSAEDLMRAFEVLTKAEVDIRGSMQPRYHLEMALLRWIHLRKLVPLSDLIQGAERAALPPATARQHAVPGARPPRRAAPAAPCRRPLRGSRRPPPARHRPPRPLERAASGEGRGNPERKPAARRAAMATRCPNVQPVGAGRVQGRVPRRGAQVEEVLLRHGHRAGAAHRRRGRPRRLRLRAAAPRAARAARSDAPLLEEIASQLAGRRMAVVSAEGSAAPARPGAPAPAAERPRRTASRELRQQALADTGVQAMLDVFAAEIKDVEER